METLANGWNSFVKQADVSLEIEYIESVFCHIHPSKSKSENYLLYLVENVASTETWQVHIITFRWSVAQVAATPYVVIN